MTGNFTSKNKGTVAHTHFWFFAILLSAFFLFFLIPELLSSKVKNNGEDFKKKEEESIHVPLLLNTVVYDKKLKELANNPPPKIVEPKIDPTTGQPVSIPPPKPELWPVETVYPNGGAILPFSRVVAYYGNLYSKKMGVLGEYPEEEMLQRLKMEVEKWQDADPKTPVIPALHYIAVVAQQSAGLDGKYRARMPNTEIDKVINMAEKINGLVFLDLQVGLSTLEAELPFLETYLKLPNVHLGIDPEFSMKTGVRPGKVIGAYDARDINFAANFLAQVVKENKLTPKILTVHRFTQSMVTNYKDITPLPEVQIVMHMDGWGPQAQKLNTYKQFIYKEPVQFTGFKIFYKNDTLGSDEIVFSPAELLKLNPKPIYIQYQ